MRGVLELSESELILIFNPLLYETSMVFVMSPTLTKWSSLPRKTVAEYYGGLSTFVR